MDLERRTPRAKAATHPAGHDFYECKPIRMQLIKVQWKEEPSFLQCSFGQQ